MFEKTAFSKFLKCFENVEFGSVEITDPEGKKYFFEGNSPGESADLKINKYSVITNLVAKGDIGLAEDYQLGNWDSSELTAFILFALQNQKALNKYIYGSGFYRFVANVIYYFNRNSLKGSKRNISAHYDLGNDFYKLWLDDTMTYSSAIFKDGSQNLFQAQHNKYDRILDLIGDSPSEILEVGCGWGGFAERAISTKDHSVKGITLSNEQHDFANKRLKAYNDNAKIVLEDYRNQQGKFDNIVSIEMFEAVGEKFWPTYFSKLSSLLSHKGKAVIQTITVHDDFFESYRKGGDLIRTFIFPGGMLPSETRFKQEVEKAGLKITDKFKFGQDYSKTLDSWLKTFDEKVDEIRAMGFDDKFIRIWRLYLASCSASFSVDRTNVMQVEVQHA